jgi:hypothetical protein
VVVVPASSADSSATPARSTPVLPEAERRILDFEQQWWRHAGAKEEAIRLEFGLSAARYYQMLNATLDRPEALVFDPMLVRRLRRLRDARTAARSARTLGGQTGQPDSTDHDLD